MTTSIALTDYEIERGKPMPDKNHALIQGNLLYYIRLKYGETFSLLPEVNLDLPIRERVPDLAIFPPMDFIPSENEIRMREIPLGVIEILPARQDLSELMIKCAEYFSAGVKSYWLALPALRTIYVFATPDQYEIYSGADKLIDHTLGIELDLADIFR